MADAEQVGRSGLDKRTDGEVTPLLRLAALFAQRRVWKKGFLEDGNISPAQHFLNIKDEKSKNNSPCFGKYRREFKRFYKEYNESLGPDSDAPTLGYKCVPYWGERFWDRNNEKKIFILTHGDDPRLPLSIPIYMPVIEMLDVRDAYAFGASLNAVERKAGFKGYKWGSYMSTWVGMHLVFGDMLGTVKKNVYCCDLSITKNDDVDREFLQKEVEITRPDVLLCVGSGVSEVLKKSQGISRISVNLCHLTSTTSINIFREEKDRTNLLRLLGWTPAPNEIPPFIQ